MPMDVLSSAVAYKRLLQREAKKKKKIETQHLVQPTWRITSKRSDRLQTRKGYQKAQAKQKE